MNQRKAKEPSDEVQGADSKPPKEKGELSDWEEQVRYLSLYSKNDSGKKIGQSFEPETETGWKPWILIMRIAGENDGMDGFDVSAQQHRVN